MLKLKLQKENLMVDYNNNLKIMSLRLPKTLSFQFDKISTVVEDIGKKFDDFSQWYFDFIDIEPKDIFEKNLLDDVIKYSNDYIESLGISYDDFLNEHKKRKNIIFTPTEIKKILITSVAFRILVPVLYSTKCLSTAYSNRIKSEITQKVDLVDTLTKLYEVIRSRIKGSTITDKYIWSLVKVGENITPEDHVLVVFNYFCHSLFPILELDKNPITFLVKVLDDSIKWIARTRYKEKFIFSSENFGSIDYIFSNQLSDEILQIISSNNLLKEVSEFGLKILEQKTSSRMGTENFDILTYKLDKLTTLPQAVKIVLIPTITNCFGIPQKYLLKTSSRILILVGSALYAATEETVGREFPYIHDLFVCYSEKPDEQHIAKCKIKTNETILNSTIYGIDDIWLKYDIYSNIIATIWIQRKKLISIITGMPPSYAHEKSRSEQFETQVVKYFDLILNHKEYFLKMREQVEKLMSTFCEKE